MKTKIIVFLIGLALALIFEVAQNRTNADERPKEGPPSEVAALADIAQPSSAIMPDSCSEDRTSCIKISDLKYDTDDRTLSLSYENTCSEKLEVAICYYKPYEDCSTGHGCSFAYMPPGRTNPDSFPMPEPPIYPLEKNIVVHAVKSSDVSCKQYLTNCPKKP